MCLFLFWLFWCVLYICTFYFSLFFNIVASISALLCSCQCSWESWFFSAFQTRTATNNKQTLLHITNNTINNSKPTATTIVKAQRKQVIFNSGIFQESVERLPGPKPEAKSQRKQKSQQSRHEKLQKLEKRTKTTEKYREIPAQPSFSTMLQAYLGSHTVTQSGPPKNSKILWVT